MGDFTGQVGDASDKQDMRQGLSQEAIEENLKNYKRQAAKILDIEKAEIHRNSEWLNKLSFKKFVEIAKHFTSQQMIQRRNFKERWDQGKPIGLHELTYPILQGYDSVMIKADIELGGYDQLFNLKIGREMQRIFGQKPQDIMTTQMLYGLDGRKMSTSWGNVINLLDSPEEIYGRIMSMKDELIEDYFVLTSQLSLTRVKEIMKSLRNKEINPKEAKSILAETIIELYYDRESAQAAKENFERVFKERKLPEKIPIFKTKKKRMEILELLTKTGLAKSRSEAKRLILQGGITVIKKEKGSRLKDWQETVKLEEGMVFKGGKRKFVRIKII
jgi:tyrosyl-tRNA synthetase